MTDNSDGARLRAGAAQVDITPRAGTHLAGAIGVHRPARLALDPLNARALVFESGGRRLGIVALDVTIITEEYTAAIRERVAGTCGIEPDALMVHATQTHSAPTVGDLMVDPDFEGIAPELSWVGGADMAYSSMAAERAADAVALACEHLEPVEIGAASGIEGRFAFNRRAVRQDGTVGMPPRHWPDDLGPTWIRYIEGPIDPELGVMCVRGDDLRMRAMLVNHTCHPVHGFPTLSVSADWPGAWAAELQRLYGSDCVPVVTNGACGNINPWPPFEPEYAGDQALMGRGLTETTRKVVETIDFTDAATLDWRVHHLPIPIRELTDEEFSWAEGILADSPTPALAEGDPSRVTNDWSVASSIWSVHLMRQRSPMLDYEIQVLRIGDLAVVGLPGEPFVELGLAIKLASPTLPTWIAHCTSQYVGYIPMPDALARGGHEAETRYWAKLVPEAFDMIRDEAITLLREVSA